MHTVKVRSGTRPTGAALAMLTALPLGFGATAFTSAPAVADCGDAGPVIADPVDAGGTSFIGTFDRATFLPKGVRVHWDVEQVLGGDVGPGRFPFASVGCDWLGLEPGQRYLFGTAARVPGERASFADSVSWRLDGDRAVLAMFQDLGDGAGNGPHVLAGITGYPEAVVAVRTLDEALALVVPGHPAADPASSLPSAGPIPVTCDPAPWTTEGIASPTPEGPVLDCQPSVEAARRAFFAPEASGIEFGYGWWCEPGTACLDVRPSVAHVIFHFTEEDDLWLDLIGDTAADLGIRVVRQRRVPASSAVPPASPVPAPTGSAVTGEARDDDFALVITTDRGTYRSDEVIPVEATLTYLGAEPLTVGGSGSGLLTFKVQQLEGSFVADGRGGTLDCRSYPFSPGQSISKPYFKAGGYDASAPDRAFWVRWFQQPLLILPPGRYRISAFADYDTEGTTVTGLPTACGDSHELTTSVTVRVVEARP